MNPFILTYKLNDQELKNIQIDWLLLADHNAKPLSSLNFQTSFCLGNLKASLYWYLLNQAGIFKQNNNFYDYLPLSYLSIPQNMQNYLLRSYKELYNLPGNWLTKNSFLRNTIHEEVLVFLAKAEKLDLNLSLKKFFDFKIAKEQFILSQNSHSFLGEFILNLANINYLFQVIESLVLEKADFYQNKQLLFTKQALNKYGINFSQGLFYEHTAYGIHCFYLADVKWLILLQSNESFSLIFYTFIQLLFELDYLETSPESYLSTLENSLKPASFVEVYLSSKPNA